MNLAMLLEMAAEAFGERIAMTVKSDAEQKNYSYAELWRAARAASRQFIDSQCKYVALLDTNSVAVPIAIFGAALAGIPYVPLNYRLTKNELDELLQRIAPAYLIAAPEYSAPLTTPADIRIVERAHFIASMLAAPETSATAAEDADIAIQLFTSGTTGKPKAALLRHDNLLAYILGTIEFGSADEDDAILVAVPPYHIAGISAVLSATYACRRTVQLPNFDAAEWLRLCAAERISNAFLVPTMLMRVIEHLDATQTTPQLPALRAIAYGGGKMPQTVIERAMALFPDIAFTNAYGLTETSSTICLLDPNDHRAAATSDDAAIRRRLVSVGKALPTIELQVRGDNGEIVGSNIVGDVHVRGDQVSGSYLGVGSLLDADGWFPTRDRGYLDDGGYLFLDGRADDVIVRGGENISPGEIEEILSMHPAVADVAVVAMPSQQWGETIAAAVVLKNNRQVSIAQAPDLVKELQALVKDNLRSSRVPEAIVFKDELPYNEMGKVLRRLIKLEFQ
ncbi:MAG TPA: class I adenylate-forming enzyme family protein [Spongiibacteraceae bacterium]|nr:class I adenylate-forming enzyme family protein [Spongiibacteraceae bacterium]